MKLFKNIFMNYFPVLFLGIFILSCGKGNPDKIPCETAGWVPDSIRYSNVVAPIITANCLGCHSNASKQGNVSLEGYANVKPYAENNSLLGSMAHLRGYKPMPENGGKLSDEQICKVKFWIDNGIRNN